MIILVVIVIVMTLVAAVPRCGTENNIFGTFAAKGQDRGRLICVDVETSQTGVALVFR